MSSGARPLSLFISYSHRDDDLRARLDAHLSLLKRQKVFDVWHDRRIGAGREWAGEINDALEHADVVLLLVSSDFLASDYCYDKEVMRALQRHDEGSAHVVPVILRRCDWQSSQFGKLQALPRDGQPLVSYADVDTALTEVALALRSLADEIRGRGAKSLASTASAITPTPGIALPELRHAANREGALPSATAGKRPIGQPKPEQSKKLTIGAIKFWLLEIGPFEVDWPVRVSTLRVIALTLTAAVAVGGMTYWITLKPHLDEGRDFMRRGEYSSAAKTIESAPRWSQALPFLASIAEQARFGSKLAGGEHIRNLAPELDAMSARYPGAPNVLVFQGLKSYYVDSNPEQALERFTQAANSDTAHVEAHFLAAGRHIDLAYAALGQGAEPQARLEAGEARKLIERSVAQSPFADTLPRYANQIAELYELEGDSPGAYGRYAKLAPLHPLSALQSAFVSWRLPESSIALKRGLEDAEVAIPRIGTQVSENEGWLFRINAFDVIDVRATAEKMCLLAWAVEISASLQSISEKVVPNQNTPSTPPGGAFSPERCGKGAVARRTREIMCVQVLTAQRAISPSDDRVKVLENWRATRLQCGQDLQPLPILRSAGSAAKRASLSSVFL